MRQGSRSVSDGLLKYVMLTKEQSLCHHVISTLSLQAFCLNAKVLFTDAGNS